MEDKLPIEILKMDHGKVKDLMGDFYKETEIENKRKLMEKICKNLDIHMKVEEELFYPELKKNSGRGPKLAERSIGEHQQIKKIIAGLRSGAEDFSGAENGVTELERAVNDHIAKEEQEVFPYAESEIKDKLGLGLSAKIMAMKAKEMI